MDRPKTDRSSTMIKPNFFIIGAPKCGTTSLAAWLAEHPDIYMSPTKEPHFFNTDHKRFLNSTEGYERLFAGATSRHAAVGEASVWYMYSAMAVRNILAFNPDARFVVMVRNPIDMAPSLHEELVFTGREDITDFATAWHLQEARRAGRHLPRMAWEPKYLQYGDLCSLGTQLDRVLQSVPRDRVKVIFLDDMKADPQGAYREVLGFIGVPDNSRSDFRALNQAKTRRWPMLLKLSFAAITMKRALGIEGGLGLWRHIDNANRIDRVRRPLEAPVRAMLRDYFRLDVGRLAQLTGRDLGGWLA